jgi:hypothetical protein
MRTQVFRVRRRRSHVSGTWGICLLHANEWGGVVLKGKAGLRTWHGIHVKVPRYYITFVFRRRELRV